MSSWQNDACIHKNHSAGHPNDLSHYYSPFVEPPNHILVRLGPEPRVHVHGHRVELLEGRHAAQKNDHNATPLHCLNGTGQEVRGHGLKILED